MIFRHGDTIQVSSDSGITTGDKEHLVPNPILKTTCMGIVPFEDVLHEGKCYRMRLLYENRFHRQDLRGLMEMNMMDLTVLL